MKDEYKAVGSWGTLGLEIVLSVMFGLFGGRWLDGKLGTEPWLSLLGFFFGCGAAVKSIMRTMKEMKAVAAREEKEQGNPAPAWEKPGDHEEDRDTYSPARSAGPNTSVDDGSAPKKSGSAPNPGGR
ncbi:ATP synthase protein I [Minicystis rosea]|nr:ATP synthase protein I [Minicystis rosea]